MAFDEESEQSKLWKTESGVSSQEESVISQQEMFQGTYCIVASIAGLPYYENMHFLTTVTYAYAF